MKRILIETPSRLVLVLAFCLTVPVLALAQATTVWSENFESAAALTNWTVSNGTWQIGIPTSGPGAAHGGQRCAATILDGGYPDNANTQLISPNIVVPALDQNPRLRFWHWFSMNAGAGGQDQGVVEVREVGTATWTVISPAYNFSSGGWTYASLDLSAYAGKTIQLAFHFTSNAVYGDAGWYIDDVKVVTGPVPFKNPEDFEGFVNGEGDWYAEHGTWQVGVPTSGPGNAHSGTQCAATILDGGYSDNLDSRLISPVLAVPALDQNPRLRFWHWFSMNAGAGGQDQGVVEVREVGMATWTVISPGFNFSSGGWTYASLDLAAYAGKTIQLAFRIVSNGVYGDAGWYIDDVKVVAGPVPFKNSEDFEGFVNGEGDWFAEHGTWQMGVPTSGPGNAHSGTRCAATILDGGYSDNLDSRLISPVLTVPALDQNPRLRFWHWFSMNAGAGGQDQGVAEIREVGTATWTGISPAYNFSSGGWTYASLDLAAYAGKTIQLAFRIISNGVYGDAGWYIDDIQIDVTSLNPADFANRSVVENHAVRITTSTTLTNPVFSIVAPLPEGMTINAATGQIDWTPSEAQGPGFYPVTVELRQTGNNLDPVDRVSFEINVIEENNAPVLDSLAPLTVAEKTTLSVTAHATDPDSANRMNRLLIARGDFEDLTLGVWSAYSVASNKNWSAIEYDGRYAEMFGYAGDVASEDWLISPAMNLSQFAGETLSFVSRRQYTGPALDVLYSTNYSGSGNPNAATWSSLTAQCAWPVVADDWAASGAIDLSGITGSSVYVAFRYASTGTTNATAALWQIDNLVIAGTPTVLVNTDVITYSLGAGAPAGMTINGATGVITWAPTEAQAPATYNVTLIASDNGVPSLSDSKVLVVEALEVNEAPVLATVAGQSAYVNLPFSLTVTATDVDLPAQGLTFTLGAGAPSGATINPSTGVLQWTPAAAGSFTIPITVTDDGTPALSDSKSFGVEVRVATIPTISTQPVAQVASVGSTVTLNAAANAVPAPTYQWQKNGVNISGATNATLTLTDVQLSDTGTYALVATNFKGFSTSGGAKLTVYGGGTIPAGFDISGYLARYPDVAATFGNDLYGAWMYYRDHGIYQGEVFDEIFRVEEYLALYPDLAALFGNDLSGVLMHWLTQGSIEGKLGRIPLEFNAQGYFDRNPDVATAVNNNPILAWGHYWAYGIYEGRAYDEELNVFEYLAINADLTAAFVNDWRNAALHWMRYGRTEGRLGRLPLIFNVTEYLNRSPDVAASWGTHPTTVFLHFWSYGIDESRTFDDAFRPAEYLALNADLAAVFGTDLRGAFKHWVRYGQAEGRPGKIP